MDDLPAGTAKLVQYLNEAYGLERRLETALQAHLAMASRPAYKKRLKAHLTETKRHGREVAKQIKRLGGSAETVGLPGPDILTDVAQSAVAGVQRATAAAQGPVHALRGTGEEERQLKNAKTEYASEAEEIATYEAILTMAQALGERETAQLTRAILREERRMQSFLGKEIPRMVRGVMKAEIPSRERTGRKPTRGPGTAGKPAKASSRKTTAARKATAPRKATSARKANSARKSSTARKAAAARKVASARKAPSRRRTTAVS